MDAIFRRYLDIIYKYVLDTPIPQRKSLFTLSDWVSEHSKGKAEDDEEEMKEVDDPDAEGPPKKKQKRGKGKITNNPNLTAMQGHLFRLLRPLVSKSNTQIFEMHLPEHEPAISKRLRTFWISLKTPSMDNFRNDSGSPQTLKPFLDPKPQLLSMVGLGGFANHTFGHCQRKLFFAAEEERSSQE
jgi:hypothetical protein